MENFGRVELAPEMVLPSNGLVAPWSPKAGDLRVAGGRFGFPRGFLVEAFSCTRLVSLPS